MAMMTKVELLKILEKLGEEEFKKFKWYLQQSGSKDDFPPIKKSQLENANRHETVDVMVQTYTLPKLKEGALKVLKKMNKNDLVRELSGGDPGDVGQSQEENNPTPLQPDSVALHTARNKNDDPSNLIFNIVKDSQERTGMSLPSLTKVLAAHDVDQNKARIQTSVARMVEAGALVQTDAVGGPFYKFNAETKTKKKKPGNKAAPRTQKISIKTPTAAKTSNTAATTKQPAKPAAARKGAKRAKNGPKEAKKPAEARKVAKKPKRPKEPKKPATAKKAAKRPKKEPKKGGNKVPAAKKAPMKKGAATKVGKAANKKK